MIDGARGQRRIGDAKPQHSRVTEPEGESSNEADLGDCDRVEAIGRIDAVAHRAAGQDAGADIMPDRIAGEACQRCGTIRHVPAPDRAQSEEIVERQREIAGGDAERGPHDVVPVGIPQRIHQVVEVDVAQVVIERHNGQSDNGSAESDADPAPADFFIAEAADRARRPQRRLPSIA